MNISSGRGNKGIKYDDKCKGIVACGEEGRSRNKGGKQGPDHKD